jgi:predicted HTH transcriptional regulator
MRDYFLLNEYTILEENNNVYFYEENEYKTVYNEIVIKTYFELVKYCIKKYERDTDQVVYNRTKIIEDVYYELISEYDEEIDNIKIDDEVVTHIIDLISDFNE